MDVKDLHPDPADYQIIRFTNCLQIAACMCSIVAAFVPECRDASQLLNCIAELAMRTVEGCMGAQISLEIIDSKVKYIAGGTAHPLETSVPQAQVMVERG